MQRCEGIEHRISRCRQIAALCDPTRGAILARLATGETSVKALAEPFAISAPAITKHLNVLQRAGLITQGRQAQWRPCRLEATRLRDVADWVGQYRSFREARLDRLEAYLAQMQRTPGKPARTRTAMRKPRRSKGDKP